MLKIVFGRPRGAPSVHGPFRFLVYDGRTLSDGAGAIAFHGDHSWHVGDTPFSRMDIAGPVEVVLSTEEGPGAKTFGPFTDFSCVDGVAYAESHVFAFMDEQHGDWYCIQDARHWRRMTLRPA